MVIDTSALIAVLTGEPDAEEYAVAVDRDAKRLMSVASILETTIVLESRYGEEGPRELDVLMRRLPIEAVPVDGDQLEWARYAWRAYGRSHHPAALNFGDCFSYALARQTGEPLLYKGTELAQTDIRSALA